MRDLLDKTLHNRYLYYSFSTLRMPIDNLYSKRNGKQPDVFTYHALPEKLKNQIVFIIVDFMDKNLFSYSKNKFWKEIYEILTREHGKTRLVEEGVRRVVETEDYISQVIKYFKYETNINALLDIVELVFRNIQNYKTFLNGTPDIIRGYNIEQAIEDLNIRFRENGIGFKFENGIIVKFDNELLHKTITREVLQYLTDPRFKSINDEILSAHEHYRHGNLEECINDCLKAFESTMKIICHTKKFTYNQNDTSKKLVQILYDNNFIPVYVQSGLTGLRATLESGVATIRNKTSGHGKGVAVVDVNSELVSYTLNLTGSTIKFLLELLN